MLKVVPLRYGTIFKKAFSDSEVFSRFISDVVGEPIHVNKVEQEYRYPEAVGRVNVTYDLFGEDVEHRVIIEVQHIREHDFFDRFLHYHAVGIVEQATGQGTYACGRTVYTVVVLTTEPRDEKVRFSVAVSDMDPITEQGRNLGVYRHRLVFLNPRVINDKTPPGVRRWMELIADSLDEQVEESRYPDPLLQRVIGVIRGQSLSPDEAAALKDEAAWEETKRDARLAGKLDHAREILVKLARAAGLALDEATRARIEACEDMETLERWTLKVPGAGTVGEVFD